MTVGLFIFTRDLRIEDNTGLNFITTKYDKIILLFIITETQIGVKNKYRSERAISYIHNALSSLNKLSSNKLHIIYTKKNISNVIDKINKIQKINGIVINKDYSPYATKRSIEINNYCIKNKLQFDEVTDILLYDMFIYNSSNDYYKKFTPYYKKTINKKIRLPETIKINNKCIKLNINNDLYKLNNNISNIFEVDRKNIINNIKKYCIISELSDKTSKLSIYLKYGIVSIREIYQIIKNDMNFVRSLTWRDFYYTYYYHSPEYLKYGEKYNIKWSKSDINLEKWKNGQIGFPVIDAIMRELNSVGFINNRCRMITASFLSKDLLIDWREGEKYFSQKLIDIDWIINNGNWQNVIGVASHSMLYFRIFNPWLQSQKFDPECIYIKKWIPELKNIPNKHIHNWYKFYKNYKNSKYPIPVIEHSIQKEKFIQIFKN